MIQMDIVSKVIGGFFPALLRMLLPGFGQVKQGRKLEAALFFVGACIAWIFLMGWIIHLWSFFDAAMWKP